MVIKTRMQRSRVAGQGTARQYRAVDSTTGEGTLWKRTEAEAVAAYERWVAVRARAGV